MKAILPTPPAIVRNDIQSVRELFARNVAATYARFDLAFTRGEGSWLWDVNGRRFLDLGSGIAVCALGHAHPEIAAALAEQAKTLLHISNLYYHEAQGRLAQSINQLIAPGRVFFANSGAEANEGLYKLARRFGDQENRHEIITALNSFHGRTLAGIAATGQEKIKQGFGPPVPGFKHVPFNDLKAVESAITPRTAAILIEGIQGEGGVTPATPGYLLGLRELCDRHRMLLMMDAVQCGHFRSGRFQSFQRILENHADGARFLPDAVSMAKALGAGFPLGGFWMREGISNLLNPGSHATTFGGSPLGCAVALKAFEIILRDRVADNARAIGDRLKNGLEAIANKRSDVISQVRGVGMMLGIQLAPDLPGFAPDKPLAGQLVARLHEAGVLTIPAGPQVIRLLPPLNLIADEADEGLRLIQSVIDKIPAR